MKSSVSGELKVGEQKPNKVTKQATSREQIYTLIEYYLKNSELPSVQPLSEMLFKQFKPTLNKIDNIHAQEQSLFSYQWVWLVVLTVSLNMKVS